MSPEDKEFLARPRFSPLLKQSTHTRTVAFGRSLFGGDVCIFHPFRQPRRGLERMRSLSSYTQTCVLSEKGLPPPPLSPCDLFLCRISLFFFFSNSCSRPPSHVRLQPVASLIVSRLGHSRPRVLLENVEEPEERRALRLMLCFKAARGETEQRGLLWPHNKLCCSFVEGKR